MENHTAEASASHQRDILAMQQQHGKMERKNRELEEELTNAVSKAQLGRQEREGLTRAVKQLSQEVAVLKTQVAVERNELAKATGGSTPRRGWACKRHVL